MKPAAFAYFAPRSLDGAVALLEQHGGEAKILAGGQSLVPAMNFRMARPAALVDINRIPGLDGIAAEGGWLRLGALVRHARLEAPVAEGPLGRLLPEVARHIAHLPIRMRGTFCGSLAHADPASEWCTTALALDAVMVAQGPAGRREIPAATFFSHVFTTDLQPEEILVEARLPLLDANWHCGFAEFSRRAGDFALTMAVVALRLDGGVVRQASIALGGVAPTPVRAPGAARALLGSAPGAESFATAAAIAAEEIEPQEDIHASAALRRDLIRAMVRRALLRAVPA
ncbi:MAG: xanthine dehydrogenase family protein subunit M [Acetobacteraceae bacterium]|nr:xanthine dehydrogenase family protein subunit M [Acetobacteraceae bacterium]